MAPMMAPVARPARMAAHRPDRQVDLGQQQHQHHADGDGPGGDQLEEQVGEVLRGQEPVVGHPEDRPDDGDAHDHRQGAELPLA
jgi:hypothetical protein